jgi:hypothetical protein
MNWQGLLNRHMMSWLKMVMWHLSELNKWASQVTFLRSNLHLEFWGSRNMEFSFSSPKPHVAKWHESGAEKGRVPITKRGGRNSGRGGVKPSRSFVTADESHLPSSNLSLVGVTGQISFLIFVFPSVVWDSDFTQSTKTIGITLGHPFSTVDLNLPHGTWLIHLHACGQTPTNSSGTRILFYHN